MTELSDLLKKCPQWLEGNRYSHDYEHPDYCRCDNCKGLGVYVDVNGSMRICATYRAWTRNKYRGKR